MARKKAVTDEDKIDALADLLRASDKLCHGKQPKTHVEHYERMAKRVLVILLNREPTDDELAGLF